MTTVASFYNITQEDIDALSQKAGEECGTYWQSCEQFVSNILHKSIDDLTEAQRLWLQEILDVIQNPKY